MNKQILALGILVLILVGFQFIFVSRLIAENRFNGDCNAGRPAVACTRHFRTVLESRNDNITYLKLQPRYPDLSTKILVVEKGIIVAIFRLDSDGPPAESAYTIPDKWEQVVASSGR